MRTSATATKQTRHSDLRSGGCVHRDRYLAGCDCVADDDARSIRSSARQRFRKPPSSRSPKKSFAATGAPGSRGPSPSTGRTCATRSCPSLEGVPSPTSRAGRYSAGLPPCIRPQPRQTARCRSLPLILRQAEIYGYRPDDSNPCAGLRRYRRRSRERFLTVGETRRLGAALAAQEPVTPLPAAVIRLLFADRVPPERDSDASMAGLPRGSSVSSRLQERATYRMAVISRTLGSRPPFPDGLLALSRFQGNRTHADGDAVRLLENRAYRSESARCQAP